MKQEIKNSQLDQAIDYVKSHTTGNASGFPEEFFSALLNLSIPIQDHRAVTIKTNSDKSRMRNYYDVIYLIGKPLSPKTLLYPLGPSYGVLACRESGAVGHLSFSFGTGSAKISLLGDPDFVSETLALIKEVCDTSKASVVTVFENTYNDDIIPSIKPLYLSEGPDYDIFYPYFDKTIKETYDAFMESSANVMLFIGLPGTGKSNYLEKTIRHTKFESTIVKIDEAGILQNKNLIKRLRDLPKGAKVFIEDADWFISKRTDGNQQMSGLLNAVNGIGRSDLKIWISTNLPNVRSVDQALIRPGRLYDIREFRALTVEEAKAVRDVMGLEPMNFLSEDHVTLAEAVNGKIQSRVNDTWLK